VRSQRGVVRFPRFSCCDCETASLGLNSGRHGLISYQLRKKNARNFPRSEILDLEANSRFVGSANRTLVLRVLGTVHILNLSLNYCPPYVKRVGHNWRRLRQAIPSWTKALQRYCLVMMLAHVMHQACTFGQQAAPYQLRLVSPRDLCVSSHAIYFYFRCRPQARDDGRWGAPFIEESLVHPKVTPLLYPRNGSTLRSTTTGLPQ
jgi:hypothetical protein